MLRNLGVFERALHISDLYSPFNIVTALEIESPPPPGEIQRALAALQVRHPLLRARVATSDGRPCFVEMEKPLLPFAIEENVNWLETVERELHHGMDEAGPLFRCIYLYRSPHARLLLTAQHTIIDAASASSLLHELMLLANDPVATLPPLRIAPPVEAGFPSMNRIVSTAEYATRQIMDEIRYRLASRRRRHPPLRLGGKPRVLTMILDAELTDALARRARKENVTIYSALQASLLQAVNRKMYAGSETPMRTFAFPDLRPYIVPPLSAENMGANISMLRYTFIVSGVKPLWQLAGEVNHTLHASFQRGDKFIASAMSERIMQMFLRFKSMRMGATALSYTGSPAILPQYGPTKLHNLHGFIANFDLGPEFSAQVSLFNDRLTWDMVFLDQDMDRGQAQEIADEIRTILEDGTK